MNEQLNQQISKKPDQKSFMYLLKWLSLCTCIGVTAGVAVAIFLASLDLVTNFRENHPFILIFLPIAGLLIGMVYHHWGNGVSKGNHLLLEEIHYPQKMLPVIMAPLIYLSTIATHLFGGSAGREGTGIQMGGSIADQFAHLFKLDTTERKLVLIAGISAGFAAIFGTPLAGIVFGWEVVNIGRLKNKAIVPSILAAFIADVTCKQCGIQHTSYTIPLVPQITMNGILLSIFAGICFGSVARFFIWASHYATSLFKRMVSYPPLRPLIGGTILITLVWSMQSTKYIGLGIPTILDSFQQPLPTYDFAIKLVLTILTLSSGFKGGEVTPLFFIGATLGNALSVFIPIPLGMLAGMGFIAVFAAAANAPLACIVMSMELFGTESGGYIAIACLFATFVCGKKGIYRVGNK